MEQDRQKQRRMELKLQWAAMDYLKGEEWSGNKIIRRHTKPFPYLEVFHSPNENPDPTAAFFAKRAGAWTGMFDIGGCWPIAQMGWIELKLPGEKLSSPEKTFDFTMKRMGFRTSVAHTVERVRNQFIEWGCECVNMACREPDFSTWDDRIEAYARFVRP